EAEQKLDEAEQKLDEAEQRAEEAEQRADKAEQKLDKAEQKLDKAEQKLDEARQEAAQREHTLYRLLLANYRQQGMDREAAGKLLITEAGLDEKQAGGLLEMFWK
ncbi:MAG: hypothetical protein NC254_14130, partial [bacterium]|nr:hypothetical protein [bacterium]